MLADIGWSEFLILLVAALVILGPERLPDAIRWTIRSLRQARDYASGATTEIKRELGTDFNQLRKPLTELRDMTPRAAATKYLFGGEESILADLEKTIPSTEQVIDPVATQLPSTRQVQEPDAGDK
ncbi:Sec-independent protein translocase protein TatB [Nocardia rhizosphaerihabitans]|uniref:Sec-independent protein translocase protein TatB n=1 Tax=Nocardia rhizosphaerihabitans TaxID=1691570 RepID=UPI00366AAE55